MMSKKNQQIRRLFKLVHNESIFISKKVDNLKFKCSLTRGKISIVSGNTFKLTLDMIIKFNLSVIDFKTVYSRRTWLSCITTPTNKVPTGSVRPGSSGCLAAKIATLSSATASTSRCCRRTSPSRSSYRTTGTDGFPFASSNDTSGKERSTSSSPSTFQTTIQG